jgi:hypothetical protein
MYAQENECTNIECMCDRISGFNIIFDVLRLHKGEKFFITFYKISDHADEKINGITRDGSLYFYPTE